MTVFIAQLSGVVAFLIVTLLLGVLLRQRPQPGLAEGISRISHLAFWLGLVVPWAVGFVVPGSVSLDRIAGLEPLPLPLWLRLALGAPMLLGGVLLMRTSMATLKRQGSGAPAFRLTRTVVASGVYGVVRNPMALGYYAGCLGGAVLAGSTYMVLYSGLGVIPVHLFNMRFFEELELSLRYGESYEHYRQSTPFLLPRFRLHRGDAE